MRVFILAVLAFASLTSCSAVSKLEGLADKATISVEKANEILNQGVIVSSKLRQSVYAADKDGDGVVAGWTELWALITGVLAVFGIGKATSASKATETVAAKLTEHKKDIYPKIDDVRKELAR